MTTRELAKLVGEMREEQRKFFRSEIGSAGRLAAYHRARALEPKVDRAVAEILDDRMSLFSGDDPDVHDPDA